MAADHQISDGSAASSIGAEKTHDVEVQSISEKSPEQLAQERTDFLATFSAEEEKAIMRKVDMKFLLLIGLMYLVKNVRNFFYLQLLHIAC
jgi:fructose-1,6-bisphosphatase